MDLQQFLDGIGDTAAQKDYLKKVAVYRSEKSKYLKHFRMKRMGLIKVCKQFVYKIMGRNFVETMQ